MASVVVNGIVSEGPGAESVPDTEPQPELVIGLLAAPGPASELTESLVGEIADRLAGQLPGVRWRVEFVSDRLVEPPTGPQRADRGGAQDAPRARLAPGGVRHRPAAADRAASGDRSRQRDPRGRGPVHARARPGLGAQAHRRDDRPPGRAHARRPGADRGRRRTAPAGAGRDPSDARTGRPHRARRAWRGFRRAGHHRQHLVAAGHAAGQPSVAAGAATHARAGGGLRGRGVRAGDQRHLAAVALSRAAAADRHRSWLGGGHHRDDRGRHRAVGAQPAPGRARAGGLVQHRHRGHRRPRRGRAVPGPVRDHARRGAAAGAGQPARPGPRAPGRRGRPGEPGLAGHFDRDAGRRARRGPGERRERARGSLHLSAGYADRRRRWSAVTSRGVLRAQPSAGSHGGCQRG